ncbi:hypothetical protein XA68_13191 [Ophiocordyceps unilateralis]|uniref:Pinin/SDK/MemA protein domain-containing protein n=1 Tax=Ophiocordyceps unilateralis TaxID=268505 RepID=A0A2A9PBL5_OPHUN|nr:hypothetical protein XA68_13191 [Ophiocordyceps unilateralis]
MTTPGQEPCSASPSREDSSRKRKAPSTSSTTTPAPPSRPPKRTKPTREEAVERQRRASQAEDKNRGRRLFGGLLSALAGGGGGGSAQQQQRRRQEIERRQLDKIQQQSAESDKLRTERRAALNKIRLERQIVWEEQVMHFRHAKDLKLAQFLRTRCRPEILFLPWKLTRGEEDTIAAQVRDCKARIATELQDFTLRQEQHRKRHGPATATEHESSAPIEQQEPVSETGKEEREPEVDDEARGDTVDAASSSSPTKPLSGPSPVLPAVKAKALADAHQDAHDDSGDILVEADEDMVIY